jgi:hypothetical protein
MPTFRKHASTEEELALDNLIRHAEAGEDAAIKDLVELARGGFHLQNDTLRNLIPPTLAQLLLSENSTSEQRQLIWSLRDPAIHESYELARVKNLIRHVEASEDAAIKDLVELARGSFHLQNDVLCNLILHALANVLLSEKSTSEQKQLVWSLRNPAIQEIYESERVKILIRHVQVGEDAAIKDLVEFVKAGFNPSDAQSHDIARALATIFFSKNSTKEQKQLIWSLRDWVVYEYTWEEQKHGMETLTYGNESMDVPCTYTETHTESYTFYQYILEYHPTAISNLENNLR